MRSLWIGLTFLTLASAAHAGSFAEQERQRAANMRQQGSRAATAKRAHDQQDQVQRLGDQRARAFQQQRQLAKRADGAAPNHWNRSTPAAGQATTFRAPTTRFQQMRTAHVPMKSTISTRGSLWTRVQRASTLADVLREQPSDRSVRASRWRFSPSNARQAQQPLVFRRIATAAPVFGSNAIN